MTATQDNIETLKAQMPENALSSTVIANRTVANYRLVELKGSGGMANIFKAIQLSLDRPVALKIMHPHFHANDTFVARFENEAKRAAMLQHENIVSIIDYGCDGGEYYIAMEYIDGTNLAEIIRKQRKMPLEIALHICHQIAEGLKYAHGMGLIHRDIKPGNIMLSYDGRVMITDFGIAKAPGDLTITSTGQVIGSPSYMSPEQAAGRPTDHRSDLFSLGIILYEIIAGERPFKGDNYQSLVASIMSDSPTSLQEFRIDVTREIDDLVQKSLIKVADSRYQCAEDLSEAILAQFSKFKIPNPRKMITEYLKNPHKVTEKLRSDKISDHMESALYYLAVGEGKLVEARREFLDVLRFDKNNKEARKHLSKLEAQLPAEKTQSKFSGFRMSLGASIALAAGIIILLSLTVFSLIPQDSGKPSNSLVEVVDPSHEKPRQNIVIGSAPITGQQEAEAASNAEPRVSGGGKAENRKAADTIKSPKHTSSDQKMLVYNYPHQNYLRFATIKIVTNVQARLQIDNEDYSWANGPQIKLLPGRHIIVVSSDGYKPLSQRVFLKTGQADTIRLDLAPLQPE